MTKESLFTARQALIAYNSEIKRLMETNNEIVKIDCERILKSIIETYNEITIELEKEHGIVL